MLNEENALILATALTQLDLKIVFCLLLLALFLPSTVHTAIRQIFLEHCLAFTTS